LNLSSREIANIMGINVRSVDQAKYRVKKRMNLDADERLQDFIQKL